MPRKTIASLEELLKEREEILRLQVRKINDLNDTVEALKMKLRIWGEVSQLGGGLSAVVIALERSSDSAVKALDISNQQMRYLLSNVGMKFPRE